MSEELLLRCFRCWIKTVDIKQVPSEQGDRFACSNRAACKWREKLRKMKRGRTN